MLPLLEALKRIIERYIVGIQPLTVSAGVGDTTINIQSTRRLCVGDDIIIFTKPDQASQSEGDIRKITSILNVNQFTIDSPLAADGPITSVYGYDKDNSFVEKLKGYTGGDPRFCEAVYIGDPAVIPMYPAITIDGKSRHSKWITLESTQEDYEVDITVYVDNADYESQVKLMYSWVHDIETALFRSFYPLLEPYYSETLESSLSPGDGTIRITNHTLNECILGQIFLESDERTVPNRLVGYLGNGVYQLERPSGFFFEAGNKVIRPIRHIFNTLPASTTYGYVNKGGMLKAARISWTASEEVKRLNPYIDPLTY